MNKPIIIDNDLNLDRATKLLIDEALARAGSIVEAAQLLGITRHKCKREMIRLKVEWPRASPPPMTKEELTTEVRAILDDDGPDPKLDRGTARILDEIAAPDDGDDEP